MSTLHIITGRQYDINKKEFTTGGLQTYIMNVADVAKSIGMGVLIYQTDCCADCKIDFGKFAIYNTKSSDREKDKEKVKKSLAKCMQNFDDSQDILLFATATRVIKNKASRSLTIQHGIFWDMPVHQNFSSRMSILYSLSKVRLVWKLVHPLLYVNSVICVDYNFPNWLRANTAYQPIPLTVIPNFTKISDINEKPTGRINVIFARRFEEYRGTRVFTTAIQNILSEYDQVYVTVAGTGPDEIYMRERLSKFQNRVEFIKYLPEQSLGIHADKHIAVIPTVGSEGTSLSLLEAMSAQCAVVCTSVGGMTNIVLDGYNGLMVDPGNAEQLYSAIKRLIYDEQERKKISMNAYETVVHSFSFERWSNQWKGILNQQRIVKNGKK